MKKFVSIVLVSLTLVFVLQSYASDESLLLSRTITYEKANSIMLDKSRTVQKLKQLERKSFYQYNNAVQTTRGMNTEGMTFEFPDGTGGTIKKNFFFNSATKVMLAMRKEFMPLQYKYGWEMTDKNRILTDKRLSLGLRDLYLGYLKSQMDLEIGTQKLELAQKKLDVGKLKLDRGLLTQSEYEEIEYNFIKAQKDLEAAKRSNENMLRSLNAFLGVDIYTKYDKVLNTEGSNREVLESLDYYVNKALKERLEITSVMEEIKLKELNISIFERDQVKDMYPDVGKDHRKAVSELESLKVKLEKAKFDVENNIKSAYIDIKKESFAISNMAKTIDMQKRNYEKLQNQYKQGLIPKMVLDELEIGLNELQNGLDLMIYNYNTKKMKINEAAGLGPAY